MGNNLFSANISGRIAAALGPHLLPGKLIKVYEGVRTANITEGNHSVELEYTFRGMCYSVRSSIPDSMHINTQIPRTREMVLILGDTITPVGSNPSGVQPVTGDKIEIEDKKVIINDVNFDPDKATFTCQVY